MKLTHRGQPIQTGSEKEFLKALKDNAQRFEHTTAPNFNARHLGGQVGPDDVVAAAKGKPVDQLRWEDLTDLGKSNYALKHKAAVKKKPLIKAKPEADFANVAMEPDGSLELISPAFHDLQDQKNFHNKYGWGHVHVSFVEGAPPQERSESLTWIGMANMFPFLNALESRGAKGNGEEGWRFAIKTLSVPTEAHLDRFAQILDGKSLIATTFAKHLNINVRGKRGQYGPRNRIGAETRGGTQSEKARVVDGLLESLVTNNWGAQPLARGASDFRFVKMQPGELRKSTKGSIMQIASLPKDFKLLMDEHLQAHPNGGVDTAKLFSFVDNAKFYDRKKESRLERFDQRACTPLLKWEALPFLPEATKQRAVAARTTFINKLADVQKQGLTGRDAALAISTLMENWAKEASLAKDLGNWMDGANGRQNRIE